MEGVEERDARIGVVGCGEAVIIACCVLAAAFDEKLDDLMRRSVWVGKKRSCGTYSYMPPGTRTALVSFERRFIEHRYSLM